MKVVMHCTNCNTSTFEAEMSLEMDRLNAPEPPQYWKMFTDMNANVTRYYCPDCIKFEERKRKILALAEIGRPMEKGVVDQDFTDFELGAIESWCELIQDTVGKELERRREESKKRGRKKR